MSARLRAAASTAARRCAPALLALALHAASVPAQSPAQASDPAATAPSRWAAEVARVDGEIAMRSLVADDPRGRWIAGRLDAADPAARVYNYAAARVAAPGNPLYLASLAFACQQLSPVPPACDAVDRLADWATRDVDNGVPLLMLAGKAARRGQNDMVVAYLEQAARQPRMDDYGALGALVMWEYVLALPVDVDRAAKVGAASAYADDNAQAATAGLAVACGATAVPDARRPACAAAGKALAERGGTFAARAAGAAIAERFAADAAARERVREQRAANDAARARCAAVAFDVQQGLESADPAIRARAVAAWDATLRASADKGEVAACARRAGA